MFLNTKEDLFYFYSEAWCADVEESNLVDIYEFDSVLLATIERVSGDMRSDVVRNDNFDELVNLHRADVTVCPTYYLVQANLGQSKPANPSPKAPGS